MRGHANFAEYVPLILLMMALLEFQHVAAWELHAMGAALLLGRLLHGIAFSFTQKWWFGRFFGTALTLLVLVASAIQCVAYGLRGMGLLT
jgi:hypothetical protein